MKKSYKKWCSVVMCHHTGTFIPKAVESLEASLYVNVEIIVVTSDPTVTAFRGTKTIFCKGGPSHKRNIGAKYCSHDYLFFLDDDIEVHKLFLFEMIQGLEMENVGMVYGKTLNMERRNMLDNAGSFLTWTGFLYAREESGIEDRGQFDKIEEIFAGKGAAMALRRSTYYKVKGFDPTYDILAEETDISWKVWFIGERVLWIPRAILHHAFNTKFKPWSYFYTNKRVYFNGCRNYIIILTKFLEWKNWWRIVPLHTLIWLCAGIGMIFTGKFNAGWNIVKGIVYHFTHWKYTMWQREETQKLRTKTDKELFKTIMRQPNPLFYWKRFFHYISTGRHG